MKQASEILRQIQTRVKKTHKEQIKWRRHLHQHPEIANQEFDTTSYLIELVRRLGLKVLPIKLKTGLLAELNGRSGGTTIAVRTDIDALPVEERTGLRFMSKRHGFMHACGHDMHMATVLGVAAMLAQMSNEFAGRVRFIFQPAEEHPPGGARPMIEAGALKDVDMILGLHVDPDLPTGKISLRDGPVMASVYDFDLIIHGKGGHAARPQTSVDAIAVASEVIESMQKIIAREIDPVTAAAITFGKIQGGVARNVIADRVEVSGTARALDEKVARKLPKLIKRTAAGICKARGARFDMNELASYPVLKNHPAANRLLQKNYSALYGPGKIEVTPPVLGGEDFACYVEKVPGAMFRLGIRNRKIGADKPWHSPHFVADEDAMAYGTALLTATVLDFLN